MKMRTIKITNNSFNWIPKIQNALSTFQLEKNEKLVLYGQNDPLNGILGLFNTLQNEEKRKSIKCFFIMDESAPQFTTDDPFYKSQLDRNLCQNVYKNGQWGCYLYGPVEPMQYTEVLSAFCTVEERGDFSTIGWIEGSLHPNKYSRTNEKILAHVYYSSLNFHDIMVASRRMPIVGLAGYSRLHECFVGMEFSGKKQNGERIIGISFSKAIATVVETQSHLTFNVPDNMTLEEAATIPIVYCTVIECFFFQMKLKKGSTVLIHAGSGGVGQAAINICLHFQCDIYTTVGTPEKREFIRKTFPQIPENHIGNSRDTSFEAMILRGTNGAGVDVVLNSLSEEKLQASLRCVAKKGHFLEIGKFDMFQNNALEMEHFLKNITFHSVQLDDIIWGQIDETFELKKTLQKFIDEGIAKPLQRTVFEKDDVESAFRYMAAGKHTGKVVIKIREEETNIKAIPTPIPMKAKPRVICSANESYVIIGGLGGFGMELADWLIVRGAKNIVLSSRTGVKNGYQSYRLNVWKSYDINVIICTEDITKEEGVRNLLQTANSAGPVVGIFNLAMILKDDQFSKQTEDTFRIVIGPKATATIHLDKLSRIMCPKLEHFVVFSSMACSLGNHSQTNYSFANSVMERICETRKAGNLPALAIQWGVIGEVGYVADLFEDNKLAVIGGTKPQSLKSCLETLNFFMKQQNATVVCSMVVAEKSQAGRDITEKVANILGIKDYKKINQTWTLPELGMDSILGAELKLVLESEFNIVLTVEDLRDMTFSKLHQLKNEKQNSQQEEKKETLLQHLLNGHLLQKSMILLPFDKNEAGKISSDEKCTTFIFPGVEGISVSMEQLVKNLNIRVFCFQYCTDNVTSLPFQEMCENYAKSILENLDDEEEFKIIGYSSGGLFTLEVANILEKKGKTGRVWMIDSSPLLIEKLVKQYNIENSSSEESLQNRVCVALLGFLSSKTSENELLKLLEKTNNWQAKKQSLFSLFPTRLVNENTHRLADRVYNLLKQLRLIEVSPVKLKATCVLIRCSNDLYEFDECYGLSEYFENSIQIHRVDEEHFSIPMNPKTAEIIMQSWIQARKQE